MPQINESSWFLISLIYLVLFFPIILTLKVGMSFPYNFFSLPYKMTFTFSL